MRLKEDSNSYKASAVKRKDFRASKGDPEVPKHYSKKNRRRWCKGRQGVEHTPKWVRRTLFFTHMYEFVCQECKKKLDYFFDWSTKAGRPIPKELKKLIELEQEEACHKK